jgi:hypothetical protein
MICASDGGLSFVREPAIDAGGVAREWFQLVTEQIFDADWGSGYCLF